MTSVNDPLAFAAKLMPGFDFMRQFTQAATGKGAATHFADWIAPTLSVEELDKRIDDLKAVQFWLEQNTQALRATVQALEVQKMTLSALQGMNLNLTDIAKAFTVPTPSAPASGFAGGVASTASQPEQPAATPEPPARAPEPASEPAPTAQSADPEARAPAPGMPDPLKWWGALTQQFQSIAANAMREAAHAQSAGKAARKPSRKPSRKSATKTTAKSATRSTARSTARSTTPATAKRSAGKAASKSTGSRAARAKPAARRSAA